MKRVARMALTFVLAGVACVSAASAAIIKPTRLDDPVPNGCKPNNCSLREAITKANNHEGADRVVLEGDTYEMEIPETPGDNNKTGDFDVTGEVTITGEAGETTVDGNDVSGVFSLLTFPPKTLANIAIVDGNREFGAGVYSGPNKATLRNIFLSGNFASETGGGLYSVSEELTIVRSTIGGNTSPNGGGVYIPSGAIGVPEGSIRDSTIFGNGAELGGGLYLDGSTSTGMFDPDLSMRNSTVAFNQATVSGGGIAAILGATMELDHATVANNTADSDNSGGGNGGGLYQSTAAPFSVRDSVLAANIVGSTGVGPNCSGDYTGGTTLIGGSNAGCPIGGSTVADAMLGDPDDNGGPTETMALLEGSPAINQPVTDCPGKDQRGEKRNPLHCDLGAFERKPSDP